MAIKLKEVNHVLGKDMIFKAVFGHTDIAERVVEWSKKQEVGKSFSKKTTWGLELEFIANHESPICLLTLNEETLYSFIEGMGPITAVQIESYGIGLAGPLTKTGHVMAEAPINGDPCGMGIFIAANDSPLLLHRSHSSEKGTRNLGSIAVLQDGFFYYLNAQETLDMIAKEKERTVQKEESSVEEACLNSTEEDEMASAIQKQMMAMYG